MEFNKEEFNQLVRERRSVFPKDYTGEKVSDEIILRMLDNANWAPTHKLTEPWRFVVFCGDGLHKLGELQASCYKKVTEANGSFDEGRYKGLLTKPLQSSHIISIGMKRDEKKSLPEIEEAGAVYCAVENMYLTATANGVGCYLSTGGITYFDEAREIFDLGPDDRLLGFLHVGMPKGTMPPGRRKPVDAKVKWVK